MNPSMHRALIALLSIFLSTTFSTIEARNLTEVREIVSNDAQTEKVHDRIDREDHDEYARKLFKMSNLSIDSFKTEMENSNLLYWTDPSGRGSALHIFTLVGDFEKVNVMLQEGAVGLINTEDKNGFTPLMMAAYKNYANIVHLLILKGAKMNHVSKSRLTVFDLDLNKLTFKILLQAAVSLNHYNMLKKVLNKRSDSFIKRMINTKSQTGLTLLMRAAHKNFTKIIILLLDKGAKLDLQDKFGRTAFDFAAENNHIDAFKVLLHSASLEGHYKVVEQALKKSDKTFIERVIDTKDKHGMTPLLWACSRGHIKMVNVLIQFNADIDLKGLAAELTPLMLASKRGYDNLVKTLLEKGAKVNEQNSDWNTALMLAIQSSSYQMGARLRAYGRIVDLLLQNNADINLKNKKNITALELATVANSPGIDSSIIYRLRVQNAFLTVDSHAGAA